MCPCDQQSCDHTQDDIEAADALLMLSTQTSKVEKPTLDATCGLLALSGQREYKTPRRFSTFAEFKENFLEVNYDSIIKRNPNMKRPFSNTNDPDTSSEKYRATRNKNNEAAKRSRDKVKITEHVNELKIQYYEEENEYLLAELAATKNEIEKFRS